MRTKLPVALITILVSAFLVSSFAISSEGSDTQTFAADTEAGLVGYWKLDEGSGVVAHDSSGNDNHGTLVNDPQWINGRVGKALGFNKAGNDEVQISDSSTLRSPASTNQITIMAWVMLLADLDDYTATMIKKSPGYSLEWGNAGTNRPRFALDWSDNTYSWMDGGAWPKYEWHHIAATYDGAIMRMYTDGLLERSGSTAKQIGASTNYLGIGNWDVQWFTGRIDEVKIFNRALTVDEIQVEVGNSWPMFHHDLRHTGYSISKAPNTNDTLWTYNTGNQPLIDTPIAAANGRVYFGAGQTTPRVYAVDAASGNQIWNATIGIGGMAPTSSPAVANGIVYAANYNWNFYALNETTGNIIWHLYMQSNYFPSSPAVANGMVYVGSDAYYASTRGVFALNATTGSIIWFYPVRVTYSSPAVADGVVYIMGASNLYALNATTGAKIWNYTMPGYGEYVSPAVADGKVYTALSYYVYALNKTTGTLIWRYDTGTLSGGIRSSPAVAYGMVYIGSQNGNVYALDATTGAKIWNYTAADAIYQVSPAVADGKVYIGTGSYYVYALNATTGTLIWRYYRSPGGGGSMYSSPAVAYGNVYIGGQRLYAFGGKHNLTVVAPSGGTTNPLDGSYIYPTETFISVSAIPDVNYRLDHWELDGINVGVANPFSLTMGADHTLRAVFAELPIPPDIAIINAAPSKRVVGQGYNMSINVTLANQGASLETFYVTVKPAPPSYPTPGMWFQFWMMGDVDKNGYINKNDQGLINSARGSTPGAKNWNRDADLNSDTRVNWMDYFICSINQGKDIWSLNRLPDPIGPERVDLQAGASTTLTFVWNTENIAKANYTISATADPVSGEIDTDDNTFTDGNVTVTTQGDINGDQIVNNTDLAMLSEAYGSLPSSPNWNPEADINTDLIVNVIDLKILGKNYVHNA